MIKENSQTRRILLLAGMSLLALGILLSFHDVRSGIVKQLGSAVGMYAAVEENEYNTLAQQIQEKEQELTEREQEIVEREQVIEKRIEESESKAVTYVTAIGLLLLVLVLLNFYYDWRHRLK